MQASASVDDHCIDRAVLTNKKAGKQPSASFLCYNRKAEVEQEPQKTTIGLCRCHFAHDSQAWHYIHKIRNRKFYSLKVTTPVPPRAGSPHQGSRHGRAFSSRRLRLLYVYPSLAAFSS